MQLSPCPNDLRRQFYATYRSDPVLRSVDAFVCTHASSLCELFMPFQRPLIVIASTRYEIGRHDLASWTRWNGNLVRIASSPFNTVAANNRYDQVSYVWYCSSVMLLVTCSGDLFCSVGVHPLLHRSGQRAAATEHMRLRDGEVRPHSTRGAVGSCERYCRCCRCCHAIHECSSMR